MKRLPFILAGVVVIVLVAAALIALVAPGFIDWNPYRGAIAARLSQLAGRPVALRGGVAFSLLPVPNFSADDVTIGGPAGTVGPDLVRFGRIELRAALLPLLSGRIEIESAELRDPTLMLDRIRPSLLDRLPGLETGRTAATTSGTGADSVRLDRVTIRNGTVIYRDPIAGRIERIEAVDARVSAESLAGPFLVQAGFTARGVALRGEIVTGRLSATGPMPLRMALSLPATKAVARFAGVARFDDAGRGELQGDLRAEGPALPASAAALLRLLGHPIPASAEALEPPAAQRFFGRAGVTASSEAIALTGLELQIGDATGTGSVRVGLGDRPSIESSLSFSLVDLDPWFDPRVGSARSWLAAIVHGPTLCLPSRLSGRFDLSIDALSARGGMAREVRLDATLADRTLTVGRLTAQGPGGLELTLAGTLATDAACAAALDFGLEASADNLRGLLDWLKLDLGAVPPDRFRKFSAMARLKRSGDQVEVTGIDLGLDTTRATGGLTMAGRDRPTLGLQLDVDHIDLDAYRPPLARLATLAAGTDANLGLHFGHLTLGGIAITGIEFDASLHQGGLAIRKARIADLAGVSASLTGAIGAIVPPRGIDLRLSGQAASLASLERVFGLSGLPASPVWSQLGAVDLAATVAGEPERLTVAVRLGAAGGSLEAGGLIDASAGITLAALGRWGFDLKARLIDPGFARLVRLWWPDYQPAAGEPGPVDVFAQATGTAAHFTLSAIQGTLGGVPVRGRIALDRTPLVPRVDADLQTGALVFDRFLPRGWFDDGINLDRLRDFDAELGLTAAAIAGGGLQIEAPALKARVVDGTLVLDQFDGKLLGGQIGLSGRGGGAPGTMPIAQLSVTVVKARVGEALMFSPGSGGIGDGVDVTRGSLDLDAELAWSGFGMVTDLGGTGRITVTDGVIAGIDLAQIRDRIDRIRLPRDVSDQLGRGLPSGGESRFSRLAGSFRIEHGRVRTDDFSLTAEGGSATAAGSADLAGRTLDLAFSVKLAREPPLPALGLALRGSLDRPRRSYDLQELQAYVTERVAENALHKIVPGIPVIGAPRPPGDPSRANQGVTR